MNHNMICLTSLVGQPNKPLLLRTTLGRHGMTQGLKQMVVDGLKMVLIWISL